MEKNSSKNSRVYDKAKLYETLSPIIKDYLIEIGSNTSIENYLKELAVTPIFIDRLIIGFWGLTYVSVASGRRQATIKAFFIKKEHRGKYRNRAADDLIRALIKEGVTDLEIWAYPEVQKWLEERYSIKPNIYVTYNPIEKFKVFKD